MTQRPDEQLSALLDGEVPDAELDFLLARLERDPDARTLLARYAMIGECMRTGLGASAALAVHEGVRAALSGETQVAPAAQPVSRARWRGWAAAGLAAGVALLAVLVSGPLVPLDAVVPEVNLPAPGLLDTSPDLVRSPATRRLGPRAAARLTRYLVTHVEYTNALSRNNFDSHLISANPERAAWRQSADVTDVR